MTHRIEILKAMFSNDGIKFEDEKGWNSFAKQIEVHNQSLNKTLNFNVSWDDAVFSWYENIFTPLTRGISLNRLNRKFSEMTSGEIFLGVLDHWNMLMISEENVSPEAAAYDFKSRNSVKKGLMSKLFQFNGPHRDLPTAA